MINSSWYDVARNEAVTIAATSTIVSNAPTTGRRKVIYLKNTSTAGQIITVNFGDQPAVAYSGVVLDVGEITVDSDSESYKCHNGRITAISSAAGARLSIHEKFI